MNNSKIIWRIFLFHNQNDSRTQLNANAFRYHTTKKKKKNVHTISRVRSVRYRHILILIYNLNSSMPRVEWASGRHVHEIHILTKAKCERTCFARICIKLAIVDHCESLWMNECKRKVRRRIKWSLTARNVRARGLLKMTEIGNFRWTAVNWILYAETYRIRLGMAYGYAFVFELTKA